MNSFIKSLMEERALKQKDLATILGVSSSTISQWNDEGTNISIENLFSLSKLFHVTLDELVDGKRMGESLEDKWEREYDINEEAAKTALIDGEKEKALKYFTALQRADKSFFELFEKKILGSISDNELKELEYLEQFFDVNIYGSHLFYDFQHGTHDSEKILNTLIKKIGTSDAKAIVWELQKIYHITHYGVGITADREVVPVDDYYNDYGDDPLEYLKDDEDIFFAIYSVYSPLEKDNFLTAEVQKKRSKKYLYKLISLGGNVLYTPYDLNRLSWYDYNELNDFEGEKRPLPELDRAQAVNYDRINHYPTTYEQYKALINYPWMRQIEMEAKYKEKNPIKYWEYIKNNEVLI